MLGSTNLTGSVEFVVLGTTIEGQPFSLPNDWAMEEDWVDHLCDMLTTKGLDGRAIYSEFFRPAIIGGVRSIVVQSQIRDLHPGAFERISQFVSENRLKVRIGRSGKPTQVASERRDPSRA